jgi:hypothetical protein
MPGMGPHVRAGFSWQRTLLHWLSSGLVVAVAAGIYEEVTKTGDLMRQAERLGGIFGTILIPAVVISYIVQTRARSRAVAFGVFAASCAAFTLGMELRRSSLDQMKALFVKGCRAKCVANESRCAEHCDCTWSAVRAAHPNEKSMEAFMWSSRTTPDVFQREMAALVASCGQHVGNGN